MHRCGFIHQLLSMRWIEMVAIGVLRCDNDVARFQIPMKDSLLVCISNSSGNLSDKTRGISGKGCAATRSESWPLNELHAEKGSPPISPASYTELFGCSSLAVAASRNLPMSMLASRPRRIILTAIFRLRRLFGSETTPSHLFRFHLQGGSH